MTHTVAAKKIYYNFTETKDKHFYAGVFNDFIHNWDAAFKQVYLQIEQKSSNETLTIINNLFQNSESLSLTDWEYLVNKIEYYFPFIKHVEKHIEKNEKESEKRKAFEAILIKIYKQADEYRNYATHFNRTLKPFEQSLCPVIDTVLFNAVLETRRVRKHSDTKDQIKDHYLEDIKQIVKETNAKLKEKKKPFVKSEDVYTHTINKLASRYLFKDKEGNEFLNESFKTKVGKNEKLDNLPFFIFLSFGLTRKQLESVLDVSRYYKGTKDIKHAFTRWVPTTYCYREPKGNLSSQFSKDALMLQIADELSKCPKPLYDHLSDENKQEFIEAINTFTQEGEETDKEVSHWIIRQRYENKFAYLAIRFLDECIKFPTLRFQVNIGKYRHDSREKQHQDGDKVSVRNIDEKISVFERLSEVHKLKYDALKDEEVKGWRLFPKPNYQFHKNNIGIWFSADKLSEKRLPNQDRENKPSKYDLAEQLNLKEVVKAPMAYLSFNELPALLHQLLIEHKSPKDIEETIKNTYINKKNKTIRSGQLQSKKMELFNTLKGSSESYIIRKGKLKKALKTAINYKPLDDIRASYTKPVDDSKKDVFSNSEKGKIATWLVKDITRFTATTHRKDWKGWQISEFQKLLAYYDTQKEELKAFVEHELYTEYQGLPFIAFHFDMNTLETFTRAYLKKRRVYLEKVMQELNAGKLDSNHAIFDAFKAKNYMVKADYKENLLSMPMHLSRGIFDEKPTFVKSKEHSSHDKATWFTYANGQLEQDKQVFYSYPRIYMFKNKEKVYNGEQGVTEFFKASPGTKAYIKRGEIYKNEKALRAIQRQDVYLLEMFKKGMSTHSSNDTEISHITLGYCFKTKAEKAKTIEESRKDQTDVNDPITFKDNFLFSLRVPLHLFNNRVTELVALKDLPKYRRLEHDQRIQTFINYQADRSFSIQDIMYELDAYNRIRNHELFKRIHAIEAPIYECAVKNGDLEALMEGKEGNKHLNFKHFMAYAHVNEQHKEAFKTFQFDKKSFTDFEAEFDNHPNIEQLKRIALIVMIRNKIAHNQYLPQSWFNGLQHINEIPPLQDGQFYADYLFKSLEVLKEQLQPSPLERG